MLNKVKKMFYTESRAFDIYCLQFTVSVSNIVSKQRYRRKNNRYRIEIDITSIAHHYNIAYLYTRWVGA